MKPGRQLDALIAEKVMGLAPPFVSQKILRDVRTGMPTFLTQHGVLPYSTDIAAAWEVVEQLARDGWKVTTLTSESGGTDCIVECIAGASGRFYSDTMEGLMTTAPHAICLAALRAKGAL